MSEIGARRLARPSARGRAGAWPLLRSSPPAGLTYSKGRRPLLASLRPSIPSARRTGNRAPSISVPRRGHPCPIPAGVWPPPPNGGGLRWGERRALGLRKWRGQRVHGAIGASPRHARAPTRASMPHPRRRLASSPNGGGLRWGERRTLGLRKWRGQRVHGAIGASPRHARAPTRASIPHPRRRLASAPPRTVIPVRRHGNPCPLLSGCARAPCATSAPPPNASIALPCLLKPVLSPSKGGFRNTRRSRPGPPAPFTSKCRKMSQNVALFRSPTRKLCNLRVKNLTFLAETWPFWPISVHFRGSGQS